MTNLMCARSHTSRRVHKRTGRYDDGPGPKAEVAAARPLGGCAEVAAQPVGLTSLPSWKISGADVRGRTAALSRGGAGSDTRPADR
jgi:hypothetical protein